MEGSRTFRFLQNGRKNYFGKLKFALKLVGVSLKGDESRVYKIYSFLLIFGINVLYTLLDFFTILKQNDILSAMVYPLCLLSASVKTMVMLRKRIRLGKLLDALEQEPFLPNPDRGGHIEEQLMTNCIWLIDVQTFLYWATATLTIGVATIITLTQRIKSSDYHDWEFPFGPFPIINTTYSPNYEITWCYQITTMLIAGTQFSTFDLITAAVLAHVAFQFKILQNNVRRIMEISYEEMLKEIGSINSSATHSSSALRETDASMVPWKYLKKSLSKVINYHLAIISVADDIEDLFSGLLLFVFLDTLSMICLFLYQTSLASSADSQFFMSVGGMLGASGQVLLICFWGEQVMQESQEVGRAAFESNFVGADLRFQKSLLLIMCRSQHPSVVTAGKFSVICLPTFTWILQTSYSAFTVLQNVK